MRLDTHLRRSAACRSISPLPPLTVNFESEAGAGLCVHSEREAAMFSEPPDLNLVAMQPASTTDTSQLVPTIIPHLLLPKTTEVWEAANQHFYNILVPVVLDSTSPADK